MSLSLIPGSCGRSHGALWMVLLSLRSTIIREKTMSLVRQARSFGATEVFKENRRLAEEVTELKIV